MIQNVPLVTFLLAAFCFFPAHAEALELTVDQAVEKMLSNNLTLQAETLRLSARQRSRDMSWNAFVPKTTVTGAMTHLNEAPLNPLSAAKGLVPDPLTADLPNPWIASATVSVQLNLMLALFDGIRFTVLDYEAGSIEQQLAKQKLVRDTKKAFYNLLLIRENIEVFKNQADTARKRYEREKRNFETGQGSEFSMLSAQVEWENRKPAVDDLQVGYRSAELAFLQLLGIDETTKVVLKGDFDSPHRNLDADKLVADSIERSLDLASLKQTIRIQKNLRQGRFNQAYTPVLGLGWTADPAFLNDPLRDSWFNNASKDWRQTTGAFSIFVSQPLDAFLPFSSTAVELANLDDGIAALEKNLQTAIQTTRVVVASLVLQAEKSQRTVQSLSLNVDIATRARQMAEKGYENGAYDLLQVEDADNKLQTARLNVLAEKYALLSELFDLEFETNQSLTTVDEDEKKKEN